ncbi:FAD-dependent oxidoreductase [Hymenobacter sp. J193]|uniref:FAD-dependent oxidoreductase n=1 Tax=Hymenobacter sp. J193 TaxID=2898429 RepID=UPI00215082DB|nr:FAD-dependent oxidoreductase [Hymenobacter sp. J193]MCR5888219.1 FAD-dependent oxidoreductase [Hymenobacter sp. J193]
MRTDVTPEGFRLDRGFQVLLTRYPEVQRLMDYGALNLKPFRQGAIIRLPDGEQTTLLNPLRQPAAAFTALASAVGTLPDKLRIVSLARHVTQHTPQELLNRPDLNATDTLRFLHHYGWSEQMITSFFRPFFGGVFLDRDLRTAANFFEFVFQQFAEGEAVVPALGMQQIPEQLAARLPAGTVRLNSPVEAIDGTTVRLWTDQTLEAAAVVVAVDGEAARKLLPRQPAAETGWNQTTCTYFAAPAALPSRHDRLLRLNAAPDALAHNVAFPAEVSADYAPTGQRLVSVSTHGPHGLSEADLTARLRPELTEWFGPDATRWQHLRTYTLPQALPAYPAGQPAHQPLRLTDHLYRCGDYTAYPSLNAAMQTGREVAEQLLAN